VCEICMCEVCMCVRCTCVGGGNKVRVQLHTNRCTSLMVSYLTAMCSDMHTIHAELNLN